MLKPKSNGNTTLAYVRVSTGRQVDEGNSIDTQQQKIMHIHLKTSYGHVYD